MFCKNKSPQGLNQNEKTLATLRNLCTETQVAFRSGLCPKHQTLYDAILRRSRGSSLLALPSNGLHLGDAHEPHFHLADCALCWGDVAVAHKSYGSGLPEVINIPTNTTLTAASITTAITRAPPYRMTTQQLHTRDSLTDRALDSGRPGPKAGS